MAKCRVRAINQRCKQANSIEPWGVGGVQPCKERERGTAPQFFFDDCLSKFGNNVLVLKHRILGNVEFQKTGSYVSERPDNLSVPVSQRCF